MNDLEKRLQDAAAETRRLAQQRWPGPPAEPAVRRSRSGWLVFAGAFAAVAVTFGLLPWLMGDTTTGARDPSEDTPPLSAPVDTTDTSATSAASTPSTTSPESCSGGGTPIPGEDSSLPAPVSATRDAILAAATSCDFDTLESLAPDDFITSYGGGGVENLAVWEEEGEGELATLVQILGMSHGTQPDGKGGVIYVWPAAFAYGTWDDIPDEAMEELRQIYTDEELEVISGLGSYGGWRTGIDEAGNWRFFIAGD
jgi:hypothetical protein